MAILGIPNPVGFAFDWLAVGVVYKLLGFGRTRGRASQIGLNPLSWLNVLYLPFSGIADVLTVTVITYIMRRLM